jgi:hypothetical protein
VASPRSHLGFSTFRKRPTSAPRRRNGGLLCRPADVDGQVFFRGPLYQVNREHWAEQIPTTLKEVSLTLTWLAEDLGVIGRDQRVRLVDGKPCGSQTFAWPIGTRLQETLDYFQEHGHAMTVKSRGPDKTSDAPELRDGLEGNFAPAFEATPSPGSRQLHPHAQSNSSLTSATTPTAAEGSNSSLAATTTNEAAQGGQRRAGAGGGRTSERQRASGDADLKTDLAPPAPKPKAPARNGHARVNGQANAKVNGNGRIHTPTGPSTAAAPPRWPPPPPPKCIQLETTEDRAAWRKAMRFCALWEKAIVRSGAVTSSAFTLADKQAAYSYFQAHPEIVGLFPVAVAIHAWQLSPNEEDRASPSRSIQFGRGTGTLAHLAAARKLCTAFMNQLGFGRQDRRAEVYGQAKPTR